jgi:hypothetical protein
MVRVLSFLLFLLTACKDTTEEKASIKNYVKVTEQINADYPYRTEEDSGYFEGYKAIEIDSLVYKEDDHLSRFLSSIITGKELVFKSKTALSHSVFINPQRKLRYDTLKNNEVTFISEYFFGDMEYQKLTINGKLFRNYKWNGIDSLQEDIYDVNHDSFRYFSYKGKSYYYFNANIMGMLGSSAGNIYYHFVCDSETLKFNLVYSCRFGKMLIGDADGDEYLDFLHFDNSDFCTTVPFSDNVIIWLYSANKEGEFVVRKDLKGKEYFIEGNTGAAYTQDSFNVKKYSWPVKILR